MNPVFDESGDDMFYDDVVRQPCDSLKAGTYIFKIQHKEMCTVQKGDFQAVV